MADSPVAAPSKDNMEASAKGDKEKGKKEDKLDAFSKEKTTKIEKGNASQRGSISKGNPPMNGSATGPVQQQKQQVLRYMPTYRMVPKNPLNKERVEIIMKNVMNKCYNNDYSFHPKHSLHTAAQVGEEIKNRIKLLNYDRYRYIVLITTGEQLMQGLCTMVNFLWDADKDGFVKYTIETPKFFAVCSVFYIYYD